MGKKILTGKIQREQLSRRTFLGTTAAAAAAFTIIPRHVHGWTRIIQLQVI